MRYYILTKGKFYPYPEVSKNIYLNPSQMHEEIYADLRKTRYKEQ